MISMAVDEPDLEWIDEELWDVYVTWCEANEVAPTYKGFYQFVDEHYD